MRRTRTRAAKCPPRRICISPALTRLAPLLFAASGDDPLPESDSEEAVVFPPKVKQAQFGVSNKSD